MAIFEDDFESYSLGTNLPFGSWTGSGGTITAEGPYPSNTKSLRLNGIAGYTNGSFYSSLTIYFVFRTSLGAQRDLVDFQNGPNAFNNTFTLFSLRVESDGTLTARVPVSSETIGNSYDRIVRTDNYNFVQINLTLTDVMVSGVQKMNVECHIALNGIEVITRNFTTTLTSTGLANGVSEVNIFNLTTNGAIYDNFTLTTLQSIVSYPHPGTPKIFIEQGGIELARAPDTAKINVFQGGLEIGRLPDSAKIKIYAGGIELLRVITPTQGLWKVKEI